MTVPPHRYGDIAIAEDLVEEVLRIYGVNRIAATPPALQMALTPLPPLRHSARVISDLLVAQNFFEMINFAFLGEELLGKCGLTKNDAMIEVANPISADAALMRTGLLPMLLQRAQENLRHCDSLRCFEIGKVFRIKDGAAAERTDLAGLLVGEDLTTAKGVVERLAAALRLPIRFAEYHDECPLVLQQADILLGAEKIGAVFNFRSSAREAFDLPQPTAGFRLTLDAIAAFASKPAKIVSPPKFPAVEYDLSVLAPTEFAAGKMLKLVSKLDPLIVDVRVLDIFIDDQLRAAGQKSVTLHFEFRSDERTLTSAEVDTLKTKLAAKLAGAGLAERFS